MKGPFFTTISTSSSYSTRRWYTTDKEMKRKPLPYEFHLGQHVKVHPSLAGKLSPTWASGYAGFNSGVYKDAMARLHNRALAAWYEKIRGGLQLGVDVAEGDQTLRLISNTLRAMRNPMKAWQNKYRSLKKDWSWRTPLRETGSAWLAFHFGVEPLIKELHELMELLEKQLIKNETVTVTKVETMPYVRTAAGLSENHSFRCLVRISGKHRITNMDLAMGSSLGLINPATVAWELVPYSFVVDWFFPISTYLNQLDALAGREVTDAYSTWYVIGALQFSLQYPQVNYGHPAYGIPQYLRHVNLLRTIGVPGAKLQKIPFKWNLSAVRAATSIALLSQALPKTSRN